MIAPIMIAPGKELGYFFSELFAATILPVLFLGTLRDHCGHMAAPTQVASQLSSSEPVALALPCLPTSLPHFGRHTVEQLLDKVEAHHEDLDCPICQRPMLDAVMLNNGRSDDGKEDTCSSERGNDDESCGHVFCRSCLVREFDPNNDDDDDVDGSADDRKSMRCPLCRKACSSWQAVVPYPGVRRKVCTPHWWCPACSSSPRPPLPSTASRRDAQVADLRVECNVCGQQHRLGKDGRMGGHLDVCKAACAHCGAGLPRSSLDAHAAVCPARPILCPDAQLCGVSCGSQCIVATRDVEQHRKSTDHIQLLRDAVGRHKRKLDEADGACDELRRQVRKLEADKRVLEMHRATQLALHFRRDFQCTGKLNGKSMWDSFKVPAPGDSDGVEWRLTADCAKVAQVSDNAPQSVLFTFHLEIVGIGGKWAASQNFASPVVAMIGLVPLAQHATQSQSQTQTQQVVSVTVYDPRQVGTCVKLTLAAELRVNGSYRFTLKMFNTCRFFSD